MKAVFLYDATIEDPRADAPISQIVGYRGVDQARIALASHFRVPVSDVKLKLRRDGAGKPIEILCETTAEEDAEQCWASVDIAGNVRCGNKARPGEHTCKIHTSWSAPYPADTPEFHKWLAEDDADKPARRRPRRSGATGAKIRPETQVSAGKPANRRTAARRRRPKP